MSPPSDNNRTELLLGRHMTDAQAQAEVAWADERARKYEARTRFGQTLVKTSGLVALVIASPTRDVIAAVVAAVTK